MNVYAVDVECRNYNVDVDCSGGCSSGAGSEARNSAGRRHTWASRTTLRPSLSSFHHLYLYPRILPSFVIFVIIIYCHQPTTTTKSPSAGRHPQFPFHRILGSAFSGVTVALFYLKPIKRSHFNFLVILGSTLHFTKVAELSENPRQSFSSFSCLRSCRCCCWQGGEVCIEE